MQKQFPFFLVLIFAVFLNGCVTTSKIRTKTLSERFYDREYAAVIADSMREAQNVPENAALCYLRAGSAALCSGNASQAKSFFEKANDIIWAFEQRDETKAVIGREDSKKFLGAPYERTLASYYLGITDLLTGDYENALASFKTALLADAGGKTQNYNSDIPIVFFLMAHCYNALGENKRAEESMQEVRTVYPKRFMHNVLTDIVSSNVKILGQQNRSSLEFMIAAESVFNDIFILDYEPGESIEEYWAKITKETLVVENGIDTKDVIFWRKKIIDAVSLKLSQAPIRDYERFINEKEKGISVLHYSDNLLIILDLGQGPYKYSSEGHGTICKIQKSSYLGKGVQVTLGDSADRQSTRLADIYFQASTRGGRKMDSILGNKANFKDTADIATVLGLNPLLALGMHYVLDGAINTEADIRAWLTLPGEIHAVSEKLPEGEYQITVRFCDLFGSEMPQMTQTRTVNIEPNKKTVIYVRSKS